MFTRVPTDETLTVDNLAASPLLEKRSCIPIDNLLTFCAETTYFGIGSDIY